jgi:alpha,alpha-trehalase
VTPTARRPEIRPDEIAAVIFDLDGVITDTASVHAVAWKRMFDGFLAARAPRDGEDLSPFSENDYHLYVNGVRRYDGVEAFLRSRGIRLPRGGSDDPPSAETICGLGNRKQDAFIATLRAQGVRPFPTSLELLHRLRDAGVRTAIISASRNCAEVLEAAGATDLFDAKVDGIDADEVGLAGKPDPAIFLEASRRLGVEPGRAAVVEDALAGVEAGRRGRFALVIGVDRTGDADGLRANGADLVVGDLRELRVTATGPAR